MVQIKKSKNADSRSCDSSKITKDQLENDTKSHIMDVVNVTGYITGMMSRAAAFHDRDKLTKIDEFHKEFTNNFRTRDWLDSHYTSNRHHLLSHVPDDVTLMDVIEYITDCTVAGFARTGKVFDIKLSDEVLQKAFKNTCAAIENAIEVVE